jgi:hypothetical protein
MLAGYNCRSSFLTSSIVGGEKLGICSKLVHTCSILSFSGSNSAPARSGHMPIQAHRTFRVQKL